MATPLMPHATAAWLVENTAITFTQIAEFCGLHILEVQAIADDTAGEKHLGRDPIRSNELTQDEIDRAQSDPAHALRLIERPEQATRTKGPRYTPVSKRSSKPEGIAWLIKSHPELSDAQIGKLIGTTRNTINAIRDKSHWNIANIVPKDPVTLGLTAQRELDHQVAKAANKAGIEAPVDDRIDTDREALLEELKAEREAAARAPEEVVAQVVGERAGYIDPNSIFRS